MIPTIGRLLYRVQREKQHWLNTTERRRAIRLACLVIAVIAFAVILWIVQQ